MPAGLARALQRSVLQTKEGPPMPTENRSDAMKAVNVSLTPPEVDIRKREKDYPPGHRETVPADAQSVNVVGETPPPLPGRQAGDRPDSVAPRPITDRPGPEAARGKSPPVQTEPKPPFRPRHHGKP